MFIHHVFFWLKPGADKQLMEAGLADLVKIDLIQQSHIGVASPSAREVVDDSFDYSLLLYFHNKADQDVYQDHPDHHVFVDTCSGLWEKVIVYDTVDV
ncbi:MAG: Dabb family protein [Bacteroidota bacterium]